MSFPVALLLVESIVFRPQAGKLRRQFLPTALAAVFTLAFIIGKNTGPQALSSMGGYQTHYSLGAYLDAYAVNAAEFLYLSLGAVRPAMPWALAGCVALAAALRNRTLLWASVFNLVAILPIAFIPPRTGFAFYLPLAGWAVYFAALLTHIREYAVRRKPALRLLVAGGGDCGAGDCRGPF